MEIKVFHNLLVIMKSSIIKKRIFGGIMASIREGKEAGGVGTTKSLKRKRLCSGRTKRILEID